MLRKITDVFEVADVISGSNTQEPTMTKTNATKISIPTPAGTYGLAVEPWDNGEIYAVAADWAQASDPVSHYYDGDWHHSGQQVADFRHDERAAMRALIIEIMSDNQQIPTDEVDPGEVDTILAEAVAIE